MGSINDNLICDCFLSDPPGTPGTPECAGTTEDSITLTWEPPSKDGGRPVTGYIVEKKEKGTKRWVKYVSPYHLFHVINQ